MGMNFWPLTLSFLYHASLWASRAIVKKEPLSVVVGTDCYCVSNKHDSRYAVRTPDQIISFAEKLEGKTLKYEITTQNCEHFCNSLRYDVSRSDQVSVPWRGGAGE
ncbi:HRAS-like suppressor 2, partial [Ophiophagus hannah]